MVMISSNKKNDNFPDDFEDYLDYEDKYLKVFLNLESHILSSEKIEEIKKQYILEETPNGTVIMNYNFETKSFNYYCQNKNSISYLHLESVAQRFTIENDCKILFVRENIKETKNIKETEESEERENIKETEELKETKNIKETEESEEKEKIKKKNVFASLRTYNSSNMPTSTNISTESSFENKDKLKKLGNHFKYLGKLEDFTETCITKPNIPSTIPPTIPYIKEVENISDDEPDNENKNKIEIEKSIISSRNTESSNNIEKKLQPRDNLTFAEYKKLILKE